MGRRASTATVSLAALALSGCQTSPEPPGEPTAGGGSETASVAPTRSDEPSSAAGPATPEGDPAPEDTATSAPAATSAPTTTPSASDDLEESGTALPDWSSPGPVEQPDDARGAPPQEITGVRTGLHDGYDRVVLDLTGDEPVLGWSADYVDRAIEAASGRPMDLDGEDFLQVGVDGIDWLRDAPERYDGQTVRGDGTQVVTEVGFGPLFEGQQQVLVGVREATAFRVFGLSDPARIVIDVRHP